MPSLPRRLPVLAALAAVLVLATACAGPGAEPETTPLPMVQPNPPLEAAELSLYGGVAQTDFGSQCTATLIETGVDEAPAYMLTNGHCVGLDTAPANQSVIDVAASGEATFFNVAGAKASTLLRVPAERVEYATMRARDIAVVRLASTLGALRAAGAVPLPIATTASAGTDVVNISVPTQGITSDDRVMRKGTCTTGADVDVIEWRWLWTNASTNDCEGVLGGASGSPLIAHGEIVSIINTTTLGVNVESGGFCYLGKPCAVTADGVNFEPGESYGVDITGVDACFVQGEFALGGACPLEVTTLWEPIGGGTFGADGTAGFGETPSLKLDANTDVRVRLTGPISVEHVALCDDPASYGAVEIDVVAGAEEPVVVPITLPTEDGYFVVCAAVAGQESLAARVLFTVDSVPASAGPQFSVTKLEDGGYYVDPLFDMPEIADIAFLLGPAASTSCDDLAGNRSPFSERVFEK